MSGRDWDRAEMYVMESIKKLDSSVEEMKKMLSDSLKSLKSEVLDYHNKQYIKLEEEVKELAGKVNEVQTQQTLDEGVGSGKKMTFTMAIAVISLIMGLLGLILDWSK